MNLEDINTNDASSPSNVLLQPNDVIQLFSQSEFGEQQYVEIYGEVRKEGRVRKYGGMSLQDLLYLSGGIKPSAEFGRLEISSIVDMDSAQQGLKPTRTIVKSYFIHPNLQLDSMAAKIILKPYDQIFVRRNPTFELQQNIQIVGEVKYPGQYPRLSKFERLSSYITRAGGIKENANLAGAKLYREVSDPFRRDEVKLEQKVDSLGRPILDTVKIVERSEEPVSIELYKALRNPNSKHDIVLQENDVIVIPEVDPFVSVEGNVQSPLKLAYDKEHTNLMYYIDKAGGFGIRPWRKRVYVTYSNGKSRRTKSFLFLKFYPKVEEGSVINVPERPQGQEVVDLAKSTLIAAIPVILTAVIFKYIN